MISGTLRIGTRGSALALAQANWVKERIERRHPGMGVALTVIKTKGDIMQDVALVKIGGKGVFVKEIEDALLRGDIDLGFCPLQLQLQVAAPFQVQPEFQAEKSYGYDCQGYCHCIKDHSLILGQIF